MNGTTTIFKPSSGISAINIFLKRFSYSDCLFQPAERLKRILFDPSFTAAALNLGSMRKIGRRKHYPDLDLLRGDPLSAIKDFPEDCLRKAYLTKMRLAVEGIYREILDDEKKVFPARFWNGKQGRLNFILCFTYLLGKHFNFVMDEVYRRIDVRFFQPEQGEFLRRACGSGQWTDFMAKYKLEGGFAIAFGHSAVKLMSGAYPWAFDPDTAEGQHLHLDEFKQNRLWNNPPDEKKVRIMLDHRIRKHMGLEIDEEKRTFDPRLQREKQASFLASKGCSCWRDLFIRERLEGFINCRKDFKDKIGNIFKWLYPWAFDLDTEEGQHLHGWDFDEKNRFSSKQEFFAALRHEIKRESPGAMERLWQRPELRRQWLNARGLRCANFAEYLEEFLASLKEEIFFSL